MEIPGHSRHRRRRRALLREVLHLPAVQAVSHASLLLLLNGHHTRRRWGHRGLRDPLRRRLLLGRRGVEEVDLVRPRRLLEGQLPGQQVSARSGAPRRLRRSKAGRPMYGRARVGTVLEAEGAAHVDGVVVLVVVVGVVVLGG